MGGVLLCDDFFFTSKVTGTASALGVPMREVANLEQLREAVAADPPSLVVVDLGLLGLDVADVIEALPADPRPHVVAFGSHVETTRLQEARDAGCDDVMPRSRFTIELPELLRRVAAGG